MRPRTKPIVNPTPGMGGRWWITVCEGGGGLLAYDTYEHASNAIGMYAKDVVEVVRADAYGEAVAALRELLDADDAQEIDFNPQTDARLNAAVERARAIVGAAA